MWEVLCGRIVKILLCEGRDVEQWLEPRNISWCLRLIHYLYTLSLLYLTLFHIVHIISYMLGIVCVCLTCVKLRELYIAPQLLFRGIQRR